MLKIVVFILSILFAQYVGIPALKIVMSHIVKSVTFCVILNKASIFSGHEVSRGPDMADV